MTRKPLSGMVPQVSPKYTEFLRLARELTDLGHARALLSWDQETCMPRRGAEERARSIGLLAGLYHEKLTSGPSRRSGGRAVLGLLSKGTPRPTCAWSGASRTGP